MGYPRQNRSCKNYTLKVSSDKQYDFWAWTISHTFIGMIMHYHGDEGYVQYSNELWPNDPNFTIGSLLRFF
jgi:hypothetical protein